MSIDPVSNTYINDKREQKEFKNISFSGYKKSSVIKTLANSINNGKIEEALNWTAELICAGYIKEIWETIILILGKHIHLANPKLIIYTRQKYQLFRTIVNNSEIVNSELELRNNSEFRKLFTEIIAIYCISDKRPCLQKIIIDKGELNLAEISDRFDAPSIEYCEKVFKKTDPKEIFVPLNEFTYHLKTKNMLKCIYWLEWLLVFDQERRKKKNPLNCVNRTFMNVAEMYETDMVWLLWEAMMYEASNDLFIKKLIECLLDLFSIRYSFTVKSKRRYLIYFAIEVLTDNLRTNIPLIESKKKVLIEKIVEKTDVIYKVVKKNEVQPQSSYLLNSITGLKDEKDKTLEKFNKIFEIGNIS